MTSQYVLRAPQELGLLVARTDMRGVSSFTEAVPIARPGISNGHRIATAPYSDAAAAIAWAHANGLSVDPVVEQWAQRAWRRELASMRASKALEAAGSVKVDGLVSTLMGHQEAWRPQVKPSLTALSTRGVAGGGSSTPTSRAWARPSAPWRPCAQATGTLVGR